MAEPTEPTAENPESEDPVEGNETPANDGDTAADAAAPKDPPVNDAANAALQAAMAAVSSLGDDPPKNEPASESGQANNDDIAALMAAASSDSNSSGVDSSNGAGANSIDFPELQPKGGQESASGINLLNRVNLNVRIELGRTKMLVEDVLRLNEGSVVELDKLAGDPVDIYVNDRLVACGEVLVLNDTFSIRVNEILNEAAIPVG